MDLDNTTPVLEESLSEQYQNLVMQLETLVASYSGTRAQQNTLLDVGRRLEDVVVKYEQENNLSPKQRTNNEEALAKTAGLKFTTDYYQRFGQAAVREGLSSALEKAARADDPIGFLSVLKSMGIAVNPASKTLIDTEPIRIETGSGAGVKFEFQPRLAWVIGLLLEHDIATDEFYVDPGASEEGKMRKVPYMLVNIPGYGEQGRQIAVCNQVGETTFVADRIYSPEFWSKAKKEELKNTPGIRHIDLDNRTTWEEKLINFAKEGILPGHITRPDIQIARKAKRPYEWRPTAEQIFTKALEKILLETDPEKRKFPSQHSGPVANWPEWGWRRVGKFSLFSLKMGSLADLLFNQVKTQATKWREKNPSASHEDFLAAALPDYPSATFEMIDQAYRRSNFTRLGLIALLAEEDVLTEFFRAYDKPTTGQIFAKALEPIIHETDPKKRRFSSEDSGSVKDWPDWDWIRINTYCNGSLKVGSLPDLLFNQVKAQAIKWRKANPAASREDFLTATLPDYPAATFEMIDQAYRNNNITRYGLIALLAEKGVLAEFLRKYDKPTAEQIFAKALEPIMHETDSKKRRFPVENPIPVDGWPDWDWLAISRYCVSSLNVGSLPNLLLNQIKEQAATWRKANPAASREDFLSAPLPDYPDATFEMIDQALKNNGKTRLGLIAFIAKSAGLPEFLCDYDKPTPEQIFAKALEPIIHETDLLQRKFPSEISGTIDGWPNWDWPKISRYCLKSLKEARLPDVIFNQVKAQATKWRKANPAASREDFLAASLPDYPDATFEMIHQAYKNNIQSTRYGLIVLLAEKGVLAEFLREYDKPTAEQIFAKALEPIINKMDSDERRFPSVHSDSVKDWPDWDWVRIDNYSRRSLKLGSLPELILNQVSAQAAKWRKTNPDANIEDFLSATLPDYPDATFEMIDDFYKKNLKKKSGLIPLLADILPEFQITETPTQESWTTRTAAKSSARRKRGE